MNEHTLVNNVMRHLYFITIANDELSLATLESMICIHMHINSSETNAILIPSVFRNTQKCYKRLNIHQPYGCVL